MKIISSPDTTFSQIVIASDKVDLLAFCLNICNFLTYYKKAKKQKFDVAIAKHNTNIKVNYNE